jgi:cell division protein FtsB
LSKANDQQARRERAKRLRREIDELRSGEGKEVKPRSPREFVDERAREEWEHKRGRSSDEVAERDKADD